MGLLKVCPPVSAIFYIRLMFRAFNPLLRPGYLFNRMSLLQAGQVLLCQEYLQPRSNSSICPGDGNMHSRTRPKSQGTSESHGREGWGGGGKPGPLPSLGLFPAPVCFSSSLPALPSRPLRPGCAAPTPSTWTWEHFATPFPAPMSSIQGGLPVF